MKCLLHILFNTVCFLSLVLCVATCIFWSRSHQHLDSVTLLKDRAYSIASHRSEIWIEAVTPILYPPPFTAARGPVRLGTYRDHWEWQSSWPLYAHQSRWLNTAMLYQGGSAAGGVGVKVWYCFAPHWLIALATSLLPSLRITMLLIARRRRQQRRTDHYCLACNYDIRATPERCPECGTVPDTSRHALPH